MVMEKLKKIENDAIAKKKAYSTKISKACNTVFSTKEGRVLLKYLVEESGIFKGSVLSSGQTGEILEKATIYNEGRRSLYLDLRDLIRPDILKKAEYSVPDLNEQ